MNNNIRNKVIYAQIFILLSTQLFAINRVDKIYSGAQSKAHDILIKAERFCEQNQLDSASKYVNLIVGHIESEIIKADFKLINLRNSEKWSSIEQRLDSAYLQNYPNISDPDLSIELWNMYIGDQLYRSLSQYALPVPIAGTKEYWKFQRSQNKIRVKRRKRILRIIKKSGWPKYSQVGEISGDGVFYILQHDRTKYMRKYINQFKEAAMINEASKGNYAMMLDRILVNSGKKQLYGTQLTYLDNRKVFFPIENPENINKRRSEMELSPIESYAAAVGADYNPNEDIPLVPTKF